MILRKTTWRAKGASTLGVDGGFTSTKTSGSLSSGWLREMYSCKKRSAYDSRSFSKSDIESDSFTCVR